MIRSIVRTLPAAVALAFACIGVSAVAQSETKKLEKDAEKAWDATKTDTKKAEKATGKAVDNAASGAASDTRKVGNKIGEEIPGTPQNEADKKKAAKP